MSRALVVLASIALAVTLAVAYVDRAAFDSDQFANRAAAALEDDAVSSLVAQRVTDEIVLKNADDLVAARPILETVTAGIVGSAAFTDLFRAAVEDVHRAVFDDDKSTVTLTIADVGIVLGAALRQIAPRLAQEVDKRGDVQLVKRDLGSVTADLTQAAERFGALTIVLLVVTFLLVACALFVSDDRRRTVEALGKGAAAAGVAVLVAYAVARAVVLGLLDGSDERDAGAAVWSAFLGDLRTAAWILAASGVIVAAAAASLLRPIDTVAAARRAVAFVAREPRRPLLRVVRGLALIAAGILAIAERDEVVQLVVALGGLLLVAIGVSALLAVIYKPAVAAESAEELRTRGRLPLRRLAIVAVAGALVVALVGGFVGSGGATTPPPPTGACNGSKELCDRTLADVALPATHNAMSVPLAGWYSAEQDAPIPVQLDEGVRGLLIDTHYADRLPNGRLRTEIGDTSKLNQDGVSEDAIAAAERLRDRAGFAGEGERGMYLCHTFCELGGTRLETVLGEIREFLIAHPEDVLVVINQDYVTPKDFTGAVEDAGLGDLVYRGPVEGELPTLREMIDDDQRVVFLAENQAGARPWYRLAYEEMTEETPYTFPNAGLLTKPDKLPKSCRPNRGQEDAPVFLLNHWVSTDPVPLPSDARKVNAYEPLLARARECQGIRAHSMNLVAVNFYRQGDVFEVVDELNGLR